MKLSNPLKILVGLASGVYMLFPIFLAALWLIAVLSIGFGSNSYRGEPPPFFFFALFSMFPAIMLVNLLHFILIPFYIIHIIKNNEGSELYRILLCIGLFFMPWLAVPFYFFIYIWPNQPPIWALNASPAPLTPAIPAPTTADQPAQPSKTSPELPVAPADALPVQPPAEKKDTLPGATIVQSAYPEAQPAKETKRRPPRRTAKSLVESATEETPKQADASSQPSPDQTLISPKPPSGEDVDPV